VRQSETATRLVRALIAVAFVCAAFGCGDGDDQSTDTSTPDGGFVDPETGLPLPDGATPDRDATVGEAPQALGIVVERISPATLSVRGGTLTIEGDRLNIVSRVRLAGIDAASVTATTLRVEARFEALPYGTADLELITADGRTGLVREAVDVVGFEPSFVLAPVDWVARVPGARDMVLVQNAEATFDIWISTEEGLVVLRARGDGSAWATPEYLHRVEPEVEPPDEETPDPEGSGDPEEDPPGGEPDEDPDEELPPPNPSFGDLASGPGGQLAACGRDGYPSIVLSFDEESLLEPEEDPGCDIIFFVNLDTIVEGGTRSGAGYVRVWARESGLWSLSEERTVPAGVDDAAWIGESVGLVVAGPAGVFTLALDSTAPARPLLNDAMTRVIVFDADGDGARDLIVAGPDTRPRLLLGDGQGRFADAGDRALPIDTARVHAWAARDVNSDGLADMVIGVRQAAPRLWLNRGDGRMIDETPALGFDVSDARAVAAVDIDNDGDIDIVMLDGNDRPRVWFSVPVD